MSWPNLSCGAVIALLVVQVGCSRADFSAPGGGSSSTNRPASGNSPAAGASKASAATAKKVAKKSTHTSCGDDRDDLLQAYEDQGIPVDLTCADFTQTRRTATLSFPQLFHATTHGWALLRDPMLASKDKGYGLDLLIDAYGATRSINSSYRDPIRNKQAGGATRSRHMFGDAADVDDVTNSLEEWQRLWTAAEKANADYIEPQSGPCKLGCLHADWRNHDGGYRP
jgi:Peptidase M15